MQTYSKSGHLLLIVLILMPVFGFSQSVIVLGEDSELSRPVYMPFQPAGSRGTTPDTISLSAQQPFFDDFSYDALSPDTNFWFIPPGDISTPVITHNNSINPPSRGVVTFDGAKSNGEAYNPGNLTSGVTDQLLSHYIDLSSFSPASQLRLSFFLQPQGLGEAPEAIDSFRVFFRTNETSPDNFRKVFAAGGSSNRPFKQHSIALDDPAYFHKGFQLVFQATGSQNGFLDLWHLDYVLLAPGRTVADTTYDDVSVTQVLSSPLHPYTSIPVHHYQNTSGLMKPFQVSFHNLSPNAKSISATATIKDPVGGTIFSSGFTQFQSVSFTPYASKAASFGGLSDQPLNKISAYELEVSLPGGSDGFSGNNELTKIFSVDSVFAYDDGEADRSFGLNQAWGFGIQVDMDQPDTLTAVWISFVPTVNYNPVTGQATYMGGRPFRLTVWKDPHPDSVLLQQIGNMNVTYGGRPNHFERFTIPPTEVPGTFWVGVQQTDSKPIGVGYDMNYDNDALTYWDSIGHWVNVRMGGSLMIRPEMKNTFALPASAENAFKLSSPIRLYPNPVTGNQIYFSLEEVRNGSLYKANLVDMSGRIIMEAETPLTYSGRYAFDIPDTLPGGIYLWRHQIIYPDGKAYFATEKILISR